MTCPQPRLHLAPVQLLRLVDDQPDVLARMALVGERNLAQAGLELRVEVGVLSRTLDGRRAQRRQRTVGLGRRRRSLRRGGGAERKDDFGVSRW